MKTFAEKVYAVVARIPRGSVLTYKEVARRAGSPRAARAVGNILNKNTDIKNVPCHRVVRSDGDPGGYAWGRRKKITMLKSGGGRRSASKEKYGIILIWHLKYLSSFLR